MKSSTEEEGELRWRCALQWTPVWVVLTVEIATYGHCIHTYGCAHACSQRPKIAELFRRYLGKIDSRRKLLLS